MDTLSNTTAWDRETWKWLFKLEGLLVSSLAHLEMGHVDLAKEQTERALDMIKQKSYCPKGSE